MFAQKFYDAIKGFQFHFARGIVYGEESSKSSYPHQITKYQKMSGLETNLKSTRPRPSYYKTKTETETLKIGLETFITGYCVNFLRMA